MTDAAAYDGTTGELHAVDLVKCIALPDLHLAVSCNGPALLGQHMSEKIADEFTSFDDLIARGESELPRMFQDYAEYARGGDAYSTLYVIGWHRHAARPAAYIMNLWTDGSAKLARVLEQSEGTEAFHRFKFEEQLLAGTPLPGDDLIQAAGLRIPDDVNDMRPELDLLHLMEVQRHEKIAGHYWVGGNALLTSIDANGVTQKVVHEWREDVVGEPIAPLPIDWKAWRAARIISSANIPAGLSRLQRERMEKKARKGTLRAA
jgi:hypothetical protein